MCEEVIFSICHSVTFKNCFIISNWRDWKLMLSVFSTAWFIMRLTETAMSRGIREDQTNLISHKHRWGTVTEHCSTRHMWNLQQVWRHPPTAKPCGVVSTKNGQWKSIVKRQTNLKLMPRKGRERYQALSVCTVTKLVTVTNTWGNAWGTWLLSLLNSDVNLLEIFSARII